MYVGMDVSLRHGCISTLENNQYNILFRYQNSNITLNLPPNKAFDEINLLYNKIESKIKTLPKQTPIALDLDINTFFNSRNRQSIYTGALLYSIYNGLKKDFVFYLVKPSDIRSMLNLKSNTKKSIVFEQSYGIIPYVKSKDMDEMDSYLLCLFLQKKLEEGLNKLD